LCEESDELAIRLETGLVKRAEEWHDNQFFIEGIGEFEGI
jgi:hypothetical protein